MKLEPGPFDRRALMTAAAGTLACTAMGSVKISSEKKGFCLVPKSIPDWEQRLQNLNAKWFYTWGAKAPGKIPAFIEFVPMQWGKWTCNEEKMKDIRTSGYKTLLGFNEPDQKEQANMTVDKALELWPLLMDSGLRLGSPSGVHADGEWMTAFMRGVKQRGYRVDFITVHSYGGARARYFMKMLDKIQKLYERPIWVTEFAVADWEANAEQSNKFSSEKILKFMESVLPAMEKLDYVERYAWFSARPAHPALGTAALFQEDGTLTRLGEFYASM